MAEHRHELFKKNGINRSKRREDAQKENRRQKHNLFDAQRNGVLDSPFLTSTPYHKKSNTTSKTLTDRNASAEEISNVVEKNLVPKPLAIVEEKTLRKQAYLKRFAEWKKKKQHKIEKNEKKPPFIPWGKPKTNHLNEPDLSHKSFGPPNHRFKAPAGIAELVTETVKRQSIYVAVLTPPRKKPQEVEAHQSKTANRLPDSNALVANAVTTSNALNNNVAINKGAIPKRPIMCNTTIPKDLVSRKNTISAAASTVGAPSSRSVVAKCKSDAHNKEATAKITVQSTSTAKSASNGFVSKADQKPVSTAKDKNIVNKGGIPKKPAPSAAAKVRTLHQKYNAPVKQPERARLAVNLKAKSKLTNFSAQNNYLTKKKLNTASRKVAASLVTPLESCKTTDIFNFITSTKMKSPMTNGKNDDISTLSKELSPIKIAPQNFKKHQNEVATTKSTSVKRALLQPTNVENRPRKHNFLRQRELETSAIGSPSMNTLKPTLAEAEKSTKIVPKIPTPRFVKASPHASLLFKDAQRKKFNFIRKVSLNETAFLDLTQTDKVGSDGAAGSNCQLPVTDETPKRKSQGPKSGIITALVSPKQADENTPIKKLKDEHLNEKMSPVMTNLTSKKVHNAETNKEHDKLQTPNRPSNYLSSFVTCSRGKVSARKEREKRDSIYLPNTPNKILDAAPEVIVETPIEVRRSREAVLYFRKQLHSEILRLHALCDKWQAYKDDELDKLEQSGGSDMIDVTIGQTKLLTSKKFMQFSGLIDRCESHANGTAAADDGSEKTKVITPVDLEGFWSMLGLQVENIEKRFNNLDRWKANDWQDPDAFTLQQPNNKPIRTRKAAATKIIPRKNAALIQKMREMREAMRSANVDNDPASEQADKHLVKYCSPRRLRRSTLTRTEEIIRRGSLLLNNSNTPDRVCVIVPNRRSHSIAPTVISLPSTAGRVSSPLSPANRSGMKTSDCKEMLIRTVLSKERTRRSRSSLRETKDVEINITDTTSSESTLNKRDVTPTPPRTPSPINSNENGYKPILKTPGTSRTQPRNVSFNVLCSVKKFRQFGKHSEVTEYDQVEQVHIDDMKSTFENESKPNASDGMDDESIRTYRLRNRKVVLRPSSEFEIPK